jgi:hypothetical protein
LIDEIDRLQIDLWNTRAIVNQHEHEADSESRSDATPERALAMRLPRFGSRRSTPRRDA